MKIYIKSKRLGLCEVMYDDGDHELLSKHKWYLHGMSRYMHTIYAQTHFYKDGKRSVMSMHRMILNNPAGTVDHIDRNGLNNQRSNIRVVDNKVNRLNSKLNSNSSTGQRNIVLNPKTRKYEIKLSRKIGGTKKSLYFGAFTTLDEAIRVRDKNLQYYDEPPRQFCYPCLGMIRLEYTLR